ncbi:hypothetical protein DFJ69_0500 [Thermomonospora umbrina]|uniref:Uncharacterized protein n=1 Tax=Thermomonospora umbrina TaxID=111806 RepID=A0A3D9SGT9_9ACTN|nr:hypothetical protein DFJ69_0500 [Thermomonospora umbrina]
MRTPLTCERHSRRVPRIFVDLRLRTHDPRVPTATRRRRRVMERSRGGKDAPLRALTEEGRMGRTTRPGAWCRRPRCGGRPAETPPPDQVRTAEDVRGPTLPRTARRPDARVASVTPSARRSWCRRRPATHLGSSAVPDRFAIHAPWSPARSPAGGRRSADAGAVRPRGTGVRPHRLRVRRRRRTDGSATQTSGWRLWPGTPPRAQRPARPTARFRAGSGSGGRGPTPVPGRRPRRTRAGPGPREREGR